MEKLNILIDEEKIQARIKEMAEEIDNNYKGEEIVAICVLKGAIYFATDLTKNMKTPMKLEFIRTESYSENETTGKIKLLVEIKEGDIKGKNILIVEDILDTGYTLDFLKDYISNKEPKSLKIAVLCNKKERRIVNVDVDFVGFEVPNKYLVGYGFDDNGMYRNLPYVGYNE